MNRKRKLNRAVRRSLTAVTVAVVLMHYQAAALAAPQGEVQANQGGMGGLLQQVQDLIAQVETVAQDTLSSLESQAGDLWGSISEGLNLDEITGELGQIDPQKMQEELLSRLHEGIDGVLNPHAPTAVQADGIETVAIGDAVSERTLGVEGQRQSQANLEAIVETAASSADMVDAATTTSETDAQTADDANQESRAADRALRAVQQQADRAQAATSSQDVLKLLAQQTAGNGEIFAAMSGQVGGLSNQLAGNSAQNANLAQLQAAQVQLNASAATSLESLEQQGAATTLTLNEMYEVQRGQRQAELIDGQGPSNRLTRINRTAMRLMR